MRSSILRVLTRSCDGLDNWSSRWRRQPRAISRSRLRRTSVNVITVCATRSLTHSDRSTNDKTIIPRTSRCRLYVRLPAGAAADLLDVTSRTSRVTWHNHLRHLIFPRRAPAVAWRGFSAQKHWSAPAQNLFFWGGLTEVESKILRTWVTYAYTSWQPKQQTFLATLTHSANFVVLTFV